MKFSYAGALVALTLASLLTACGGKAQYTVQGTVSGLTVDGLQIKNGNDTLTVAQGATSFAFPTQIDYGAEYNISVVKNPDYFNCAVTAGSGTAGYTIAIGAAVTCTPISYSVGGTYSGLVSVENTTVNGVTSPVANTVTLINGSGASVTLSSGTATSGNFTVASLNNGGIYSISILTQPKNLTCSLTNGNGVVRGANVSNMALTCVPST
ncbi:MAG: hypothetical protein ABW069_14515 [Duganella sp.]